MRRPLSSVSTSSTDLTSPATVNGFDSLHDLLAEAGYKETRILTPSRHGYATQPDPCPPSPPSHARPRHLTSSVPGAPASPPDEDRSRWSWWWRKPPLSTTTDEPLRHPQVARLASPPLLEHERPRSASAALPQQSQHQHQHQHQHRRPADDDADAAAALPTWSRTGHARARASLSKELRKRPSAHQDESPPSPVLSEAALPARARAPTASRKAPRAMSCYDLATAPRRQRTHEPHTLTHAQAQRRSSRNNLWRASVVLQDHDLDHASDHDHSHSHSHSHDHASSADGGRAGFGAPERIRMRRGATTDSPAPTSAISFDAAPSPPLLGARVLGRAPLHAHTVHSGRGSYAHAHAKALVANVHSQGRASSMRGKAGSSRGKAAGPLAAAAGVAVANATATANTAANVNVTASVKAPSTAAASASGSTDGGAHLPPSASRIHALLSSRAADPVLSPQEAVALRNSNCLRPTHLRQYHSVEVLRAALANWPPEPHHASVLATADAPADTSASAVTAGAGAGAGAPVTAAVQPRAVHARLARPDPPSLVLSSPTSISPRPLVLDGAEFEPHSVSPVPPHRTLGHRASASTSGHSTSTGTGTGIGTGTGTGIGTGTGTGTGIGTGTGTGTGTGRRRTASTTPTPTRIPQPVRRGRTHARARSATSKTPSRVCMP